MFRETLPGAEFYTEAHKYRYESFLERAAHETDPELTEDLYFGAQIAADVKEAGGLALAVGGYVRDSVLSRLNEEVLGSQDIDLEVHGLGFDDLIRILEGHGKIGVIGGKYNLIKAVNPVTQHQLDFSLLTESSETTEKELARDRDVTVNAMTINPLTGELSDHHGGLDDLEKGILRVIDPDFFKYDPLQVLRVVQLAARFNFSIDPDSFELCKSLDLKGIAKERVGQEWLKLMMKAKKPSIGLQIMRDMGIFEQLHPDFSEMFSDNKDPDGEIWEHTLNTVDAAAGIAIEEELPDESKLVLMFGALCVDLEKIMGQDATKNFLKENKLNHKIIENILSSLDSLDETSNSMTDTQIRQLSVRLSPSSLHMWNLLSRANEIGAKHDSINPGSATHKIYERSLELGVSENPPPPIVQGKQLVDNFGMRPQPNTLAIKSFFYDAQLAGKFTNVEEASAYAASLKFPG